MATVTTEVEFDLDEISTYELVEEIVSRIHGGCMTTLSNTQLKRLQSDFLPLAEKLGFMTDSVLPIKTLWDKTKFEHLVSVWENYTPIEFEKALPLK